MKIVFCLLLLFTTTAYSQDCTPYTEETFLQGLDGLVKDYTKWANGSTESSYASKSKKESQYLNWLKKISALRAKGSRDEMIETIFSFHLTASGNKKWAKNLELMVGLDIMKIEENKEYCRLFYGMKRKNKNGLFSLTMLDEVTNFDEIKNQIIENLKSEPDPLVGAN